MRRMRKERNAYSVGQVNNYIKNLFKQDFFLEKIAVRGEVSNCKYHPSGHIYFTLKDETGAISCIMFAGDRKGLKFRMRDGDAVVASGSIQVYERDGRYQLYAKKIEPDGTGALYIRFERLKEELAETGMFAEEYKRPIPPYIRTLGIVTASSGAAIRDIQNVARRRNPGVRLILYPAQVQGEGAAESVAAGIRALEDFGVDAMIVGRGGGSIEDLWAFNEEIVARAVFDCSVPVISAVGHETDTTIIDYVADLRAPTPSAAAELAVWDRSAAAGRAEGLRREMGDLMRRHIGFAADRLGGLTARMRYVNPQSQLYAKRQYAADLEERLRMLMERVLGEAGHRLQLLAQRMDSASPLRRLSDGYSLVTDEDGRILDGFDDIGIGMRLKLRMLGGDVIARVEEKQCRTLRLMK